MKDKPGWDELKAEEAVDTARPMLPDPDHDGTRPASPRAPDEAVRDEAPPPEPEAGAGDAAPEEPEEPPEPALDARAGPCDAPPFLPVLPVLIGHPSPEAAEPANTGADWSPTGEAPEAGPAPEAHAETVALDWASADAELPPADDERVAEDSPDMPAAEQPAAGAAGPDQPVWPDAETVIALPDLSGNAGAVGSDVRDDAVPAEWRPAEAEPVLTEGLREEISGPAEATAIVAPEEPVSMEVPPHESLPAEQSWHEPAAEIPAERVEPSESTKAAYAPAPHPSIPEVAPFETWAREEPYRPEPQPEPPPPPPPPPPPLERINVAAAVPVFEPRPAELFRPSPPPPVWDREDSPAVALPRQEPVPAGRGLRLALRYGGLTLLGLAGLVLTLIVLYRWINPPASTLMLGQRLTGTTIVQRWVPIERMSPYLPLAVIMSEDARFCRHRGVDWEEIEQAIDNARDGIPRGGSTISMQVIKNLFLWPAKSYLRKAIEIPLTYIAEAAWPKRRMLEIYLNIAEWGPGVFGAEAAARHHFRKPVSLLTEREAALLAVALPNPFERRAGAPGPGTSRLAANLLLRMRAAPGNAACVRGRRAGG